MHQSRHSGGYSGWWLVLGGALSALMGVAFAVLDSVGIYNVVRGSLIMAPITVGVLLMVIGVIFGMRGIRVD
jgi:hypothetical protein